MDGTCDECIRIPLFRVGRLLPLMSREAGKSPGMGAHITVGESGEKGTVIVSLESSKVLENHGRLLIPPRYCAVTSGGCHPKE